MRGTLLFCAILALALGDCAPDRMVEDDGRIDCERNSEFRGSHLRVFLTPEDGRRASVNTTDDAVDTRPARTPIPGHRARDWTFVKDVEKSTSVVYALTSWDDDNPADYPMVGWRAEFPGQHLPGRSFEGSAQYAIFDGPETDPANPPELPLDGQPTCTGQAGGLYRYVPGTGWGDAEGTPMRDEYEGTITLAADFAERALSGCIGCVGDCFIATYQH